MANTTTSTPQKTTDDANTPSSAGIIVGAIKGLTQSTQSLIKNHIDLARHEAKADAMEVGKDLSGLIVAAAIAGLGYVLLLLSAILFASWYAGTVGMALTSFALALIHLIGGGAIAAKLANNFQTRHYGPIQAKRELEESKLWAKDTLAPKQRIKALAAHTEQALSDDSEQP